MTDDREIRSAARIQALARAHPSGKEATVAVLDLASRREQRVRVLGERGPYEATLVGAQALESLRCYGDTLLEALTHLEDVVVFNLKRDCERMRDALDAAAREREGDQR